MNPSFDIGAEGQSYKNFLITRYLPLPELQSTLIEAVHHPSGARILQIANSDPENLFCLSFQTLPTSSNGVAHILEHMVLCGSRKYPVKDPFFAMNRRSLNTFMNAFTGQDFTAYPASSQVEVDFYNLLSVYVDAIFHPELKKISFLQEGHRLSFESGEVLKLQGVVYNEMKGAMASADSRLWRRLFAALYPGLPYAYNSGGDPQEISRLTHEELIAFHKEFYHPSRCLFFFYGNLPLSKHLDFLAEHVLHDVKQLAPLPPLSMEPKVDVPQAIVASYPIASSESLDKRSIVALAWLTAPVTHQEELLAISLLNSLLLEHDASPLRKALLKSGLLLQVSSALDTQIAIAPWVILCKGCNPEDADKIRALIYKTCAEIAERPFPKEEIEASLHQFEFERSEINGDEGPFGLTLFFRAGLLAQQGVDPETALSIHHLFANLRRRCEDPQFLSGLLRRTLLDNRHCIQLTMKPDPTLEAREADEEKEALAALQEKLTSEEKERIIRDG